MRSLCGKKNGGKHHVPHIHVVCADEEVVLDLEGNVLEGKLKSSKMKLVLVSPYIQGSWYGMLKDSAYFKSVKPNGYSVEWADGQDLCPDELYYSSKSC